MSKEEEYICPLCEGSGEVDVLVASDPSEPQMREWDTRVCDCKIKEDINEND